MDEISSYIRKFERAQGKEKNATASTSLAREMYEHFGKGSGRKIYPLFSNPRYTHRQIQDAWTEYLKSDIRGIKFFMWKLNRQK